jgi:hypothetical protein
VAVVSLATAVLSAASTARPLAAGRDELPPALLKLAPEVDAGGVRLRVEVVDPSGPGTVRVHVRAPGALDDTAIPMERVAGGTYEARVPRPDVEEPWIVYWFEATDAAGNGPARNGSAASPFVERFGAADPADSPRVAGLNLTLLLAPVVLLLVLLLVYRRRDRGRELEFWIELLGPVSGLGTTIRSAARSASTSRARGGCSRASPGPMPPSSSASGSGWRRPGPLRRSRRRTAIATGSTRTCSGSTC